MLLAACSCLVAPALVVPIDIKSLVRKMKRFNQRTKKDQPNTSNSNLQSSFVDLGTIEAAQLHALAEQVLKELADNKYIDLQVSPAGMTVVTCVYEKRLTDGVVQLQDAKKREREERAKQELLAEELNIAHSTSDKTNTPSRKRHLTGSFSNSLNPQHTKRTKSPEEKKSEEIPSDDLDSLLNEQSAREREMTDKGKEILDLIMQPTAKEYEMSQKFKTAGGSAIKQYCPQCTIKQCMDHHRSRSPCGKVHFRRVVAPHTDLSLGACSYLNDCRHLKTCKFVHYEIDESELERVAALKKKTNTASKLRKNSAMVGKAPDETYASKYNAQWINCDVRKLPMEVLGKFTVIMADPPWDIHMELPYGTMADDEMLEMNIQCLQDDGVLLLWVTGRAMELGRTCLDKWGYECVGEILWVKTNQLQRLIRTGRTGHWLNHSKEHCLIGLKGNPILNAGIDVDVLVSEKRETSRKPDEIYGILDRLSPGTRKLEIFGRPHNNQPGWITLGNQQQGTRIVDETILEGLKRIDVNHPILISAAEKQKKEDAEQVEREKKGKLQDAK